MSFVTSSSMTRFSTQSAALELLRTKVFLAEEA